MLQYYFCFSFNWLYTHKGSSKHDVFIPCDSICLCSSLTEKVPQRSLSWKINKSQEMRTLRQSIVIRFGAVQWPIVFHDTINHREGRWGSLLPFLRTNQSSAFGGPTRYVLPTFRSVKHENTVKHVKKRNKFSQRSLQACQGFHDLLTILPKDFRKSEGCCTLILGI